MKIFVEAKTRAKEEKVKKIDKNHFVVFVKEAPEKGKANKAILKLLAHYFKINLSQIRILSGFSFKKKIIEIKTK
jgi:uncharacterized protein YggU (UPF0235/DUF167 family)